MAWLRVQPGVITLRVRLTPRADRDHIGGLASLADGSEVLQARVRAAPSEGDANAALVRLIAAALRIPKSAVEIVAGHAQRIKQVRISGDVARLRQAVEAIAEKQPSG